MKTEEAAAAAEDNPRRRQRAKRMRWVIDNKVKKKGEEGRMPLLYHGKEASREEAQYWMMVMNSETKKFELIPVEHSVKYQRVVEAFETLTKKEDIESVIKPGRGGGRKKEATGEEDDSRLSKKQRILKMAESLFTQQEDEPARKPGAAVDRTFDGKVGGKKYWKIKEEAIEKEANEGLEQEVRPQTMTHPDVIAIVGVDGAGRGGGGMQAFFPVTHMIV